MGQHFNSQPHKEADEPINGLYKYFFISTHSLTRRLTDYDRNIEMHIAISTHSLTRRLTIYGRILYNAFAFQLTASQGG